MFAMGTITVNVSDETEKMFREAVKQNIGIGKGVLGKAIGEAMNMWAEEKEREERRRKAIERLEKGFDLGNFSYKNREELYGDRFKKWDKK
ncbi:hypothetical protein C0585_06845 [Candidatus Woesearchaeota archaeon]|nr:MAG: hypothetical protein C0585_06845 [Candidatus Woesearchaeota archaeon]